MKRVRGKVEDKVIKAGKRRVLLWSGVIKAPVGGKVIPQNWATPADVIREESTWCIFCNNK